MERDINLAKNILNFFVQSPKPFGTIHEVKHALPGSPASDTIRYHLRLLADAGFIEGEESKLRVTWQGHEYLRTPVGKGRR